MVTELEIHRRELVLGGRSFGDAGPYEKIVGTMRYAIDPEHPLHRQITDIQRAERNAQRHVEFAGDFYLLRPAEPGKGNRCVLWDVPNRGRKSTLGLFNSTPRSPDPTTDQDFGNGFLLRRGYTLGWAGWQADLPRQDGVMALEAPRAKGVVDFIRVELRPHTRVAKMPLVIGLGFLAIRDAAAFLRWAPASSGNPCAGEIDRAYLYGQSQNGRFIRHMLHLGLDEDEQGRVVFDAVWNHIAGARRGEYNMRFGQPSLMSSRSLAMLPPFADVDLFACVRRRGWPVRGLRSSSI